MADLRSAQPEAGEPYEWDGCCSRCGVSFRFADGADTPECAEDAICFDCIWGELNILRRLAAGVRAFRNEPELGKLRRIRATKGYREMGNAFLEWDEQCSGDA